MKKKIILIISLILLSSCKTSSSNQDILQVNAVLEKKNQEKERQFNQIEIDYIKCQNDELRIIKFNNLNIEIDLVNFFESELTYVRVEKGIYHFIAHNFSVNSDELNSNLFLFKESDTNNYVFIFKTYSEEFPAFHIVEIDQKNNINDHGIYTYNWADVNKINITDFNEINYTIKRQKNNLEVYAQKNNEFQTILSEKYKVEKGLQESIKPDFKLLIQQLEKQYHSIVSDHWYGDFSGSFLRMKQESGDSRAWASIDMSITKDSTVFKLFSYIEEENHLLTYSENDQNNLILKIKNTNKKKDFGKITYHNKEYFLDCPYIDSLVGETESKSYKLEKVN